MMSARAYVTPRVLQWAREAAAVDVERAARKAGITTEVLERAERGEHLLTLRQAKLLGELYGRSLAFLMMPEPPDEPTVEMKFRRLRGAPEPPWTSQFIKVEREIRDRQDAAADLYVTLGEDPPWHEAAARFGLPGSVPQPVKLRAVLELNPPALRAPSLSNQWYSRTIALRAIEWAGVLVVRQPIPDHGVRGYLSPHPDVPAILVNSEEHPRAQTFTMLHEFAHLLLAAAGETRPNEEQWCEEYAGDVLMPKDTFSSEYEAAARMPAISRAQHLGSLFGVTALAAATRAWRLDLMSGPEFGLVKSRRVEERPKPASGNGNRTKVARLSPTYTDLVLAAADSSAVTLSTASRLLRTRVEDFDKLRVFVGQALNA
jgi:Zn-dependent peptidase ImmA (M78 family)/transcriptional regulator with XRE-family HTH domain